MRTVLVVDDSETIRRQLNSDLKEAGYSTLEACNGEEGLDAALNTPVDLIITDFNMPVMDGISMCQIIKQQNSDKNTPIFMLTTQSRPDLKARAKEAGVIAWILKPYEKNSLIRVVEKVLK